MPDQIPSIEKDIPGRDRRDGLLLRVPYREGFVAALKAGLHASHRYWDAGVAAWWIDARDCGRVAQIVLDHFPALVLLGSVGEEDRVVRRHGALSNRDALSSHTVEAGVDQGW